MLTLKAKKIAGTVQNSEYQVPMNKQQHVNATDKVK